MVLFQVRDVTMNCVNKECNNDATLQFDHNGELVFYCDVCYRKWRMIMEAMGAFTPTAYPIGTDPK